MLPLNPADTYVNLSENELVEWQGKRFFFIGNDRAFPDSAVHDIDYLVLRDNFKVDFETILKKIKFKELVIGSCIKKYRADRLRSQAEKLNLKTYSIPHQGALVINF